MACFLMAPSHYLIQCWHNVNQAVKNKPELNLDQIMINNFHKNSFEDTLYKT